MVPGASLVLFVAVAIAATTSGCVLRVGAGGETEETDAPVVVDEPEEPACDVAACQLYCDRGGSCAHEEGSAASECVTDCLDACNDSPSADANLQVIGCVVENTPDVWCDGGLLDSCCHEVTSSSELCQ